MSYCRWSSDDFSCDIYCYESYRGWVTHVASSRYPGTIPKSMPLSELTEATATLWADARKAQSEYLESVRDRMEPIELPHAGETFCDPDPGTCAKRLIELRGMGYRVPDYAIQTLEEEAAEV